MTDHMTGETMQLAKVTLAGQFTLEGGHYLREPTSIDSREEQALCSGNSLLWLPMETSALC